MRPKFRPKPRPVSEAVEAAVAGEDRSKFLLSKAELADMLGRDRGTIDDWIAKGCPVARKASAGEAFGMDPRDVVAWREVTIREDEASKYARPSGDPAVEGIPMKPADMIKMVDLKIKQLAFGSKAEVLVPRYVAEAAFQRCLAVIRETIMSIPDNIVRDMAGFPEKQKLAWRDRALEKCRLALKEGGKAIATSMTNFEPPPHA